ncbi:putative defective-in-cullin neddylation protein [Helianthus annuus]|nr:putative defective-in-cullin neddylation protein [Helianthus annuus]
MRNCFITHGRMSIFEELSILMSRLNLMTLKSSQDSIVLYSSFVMKTVKEASNNQCHNICEDIWSQVLAFSRCVHENLEGYDPEGHGLF